MADDMKALETELREAAARYAGCHLMKCTAKACVSYGRLKLAMFRYMQRKFENIAIKRMSASTHDRVALAHEGLASGEAMAEVAAELALVISELGLEHAMEGGHGANTPKAAEA